MHRGLPRRPFTPPGPDASPGGGYARDSRRTDSAAETQRTAGNRAATSYVHRIQGYVDDSAPATPQFDAASGDRLPAFAPNEPAVTVTLDQGGFQGTVGRHGPATAPVTLTWSNDRSLAMNSEFGAKEFYAVPAVVAAANRSLADSGSYVRLAPGGHSLPNADGERLVVVRPRLANDLDDVVLTRFMHLVQHECVEVAQKLTGGPLGHAVFRGPGGEAVASGIGPKGVTGLPRLAGALTSARPPRNPREAAGATQSADPEQAPGEAYGTSLYHQELQDNEYAIGLNEHARARVGEALTTQTIGSEPRPGVPGNFDFSRNRVPAERIWVYHYAAVVAESSDGGDQITLENFNRNTLMEQLLREAARQTAEAYAGANPGQVMPPPQAMRAAREVLERETRSAMGDMWYFKMYEPGGERSFHAKNRITALNPLTVATTTVPHLLFENHSDVLLPNSAALLDRVAPAWRQSAAPIVIEGHARGGPLPLRNLARKRADAVVAHLVGLGIARDRITVRTRAHSDRPMAAVYPADRPEEYVPGNRA
ncbi:OmpA family protein [Streptomyces sp. NPDC002521]